MTCWNRRELISIMIGGAAVPFGGGELGAIVDVEKVLRLKDRSIRPTQEVRNISRSAVKVNSSASQHLGAFTKTKVNG